MTTKIITLNLANYDDHPDWIKRRDIMIDKLAKLDPDIIIFQEVRFDKNNYSTHLDYQNMADQVTTLMYKNYGVNYKSYYQIAQYYDIFKKPVNYTTETWEGLAFLLKNKIPDVLSTKYLDKILKADDNNSRITVMLGLDNLNIYNVHFSFDKEEMLSNLEETLNFINSNNNKSINIIAGDMNAIPDEIEKYIKKEGFSDVWDDIYPDKSGYTYPSKNPDKRIDYFWIDEKHKKNIKDIKIIFDKSKDGIFISDHFGLYIELD